MILDDTEVETLTGYKLPKKQSDWLAENRILHFMNARGKVAVTWEAVNNPKKTTKQWDYSEVR